MHKGDQEGKNAYSKHVYANPIAVKSEDNPSITVSLEEIFRKIIFFNKSPVSLFNATS